MICLLISKSYCQFQITVECGTTNFLSAIVRLVLKGFPSFCNTQSHHSISVYLIENKKKRDKGFFHFFSIIFIASKRNTKVFIGVRSWLDWLSNFSGNPLVIKSIKAWLKMKTNDNGPSINYVVSRGEGSKISNLT